MNNAMLIYTVCNAGGAPMGYLLSWSQQARLLGFTNTAWALENAWCMLYLDDVARE